MENLETLVLQLAARIELLEITVARQEKEIEALKATGDSNTSNNYEPDSQKKPAWRENYHALPKTRRNFLTKLVSTGLIVGAIAATGGQREAQARIVVNPTEYPLQFGAITTPRGTTVSGQLGDTSVRIGLAACGDPTMLYDKMPLFDTGVYAQGAGYGVYATSDKAMGSAGYFRNLAPSGVGPFYAITAISNNGTAIAGTAVGSSSGYGVTGSADGSGVGVNGSAVSGAGVSGFSISGAGLSATSTTGAPLHLDISNSVPTGGTRNKGDFYLDNLGRVYVWARNDANSADVWRQVQFVPA